MVCVRVSPRYCALTERVVSFFSVRLALDVIRILHISDPHAETESSLESVQDQAILAELDCLIEGAAPEGFRVVNILALP